MRRSLSLASLALLLLCGAQNPVPEGELEGQVALPNPLPIPDKPNILVLLADDLGLDPLRTYVSLLDPTWSLQNCAFDSIGSLPCLPALDEIANRGVRFTNAWTNPTCSPTRSAILTGRFGFRTGIAQPVMKGSGPSLCNDEVFLPEVIGGTYATAAFGKWHLTSAPGPFDPLAEGYPWDNGLRALRRPGSIRSSTRTASPRGRLRGRRSKPVQLRWSSPLT